MPVIDFVSVNYRVTRYWTSYPSVSVTFFGQTKLDGTFNSRMIDNPSEELLSQIGVRFPRTKVYMNKADVIIHCMRLEGEDAHLPTL